MPIELNWAVWESPAGCLPDQAPGFVSAHWFGCCTGCQVQRWVVKPPLPAPAKDR